MGSEQLAVALPEPPASGISYEIDATLGKHSGNPVQGGRLPHTPSEIHEAIRLGEVAIKEGRIVPAEIVLEKMRRVIEKNKKV
ncbi:MAG: hypothetical protein FWG02_01840 [Holophagaceae bacterium]|nr:hypothetical protein [Holophagaceae bacterium]